MASAKVAKAKRKGSIQKDSPLNCEEDANKTDKNLDDLKILSTVGTGTFGRVVQIRHKETKEYMALKVMSITDVVRLKQIEHIRNEKEILESVSYPFIVNMQKAWHTDTFLYMLMEYVPGGELFTYLRHKGKFTVSGSMFYSCEIVCALDYLHSHSIVYRDLKPENLLLDPDGHLKITDFGFAKKVSDRTWTLCGTPEYLAPEIIQSKGHNKAVDWWSLGVLIFEMMVGYPPFFDDNPFGIYQKILAGKIAWPRQIDPVAKDLIKKLLCSDRTRRLGNMRSGADDIKKHRWYKGIDWDDVPERKLKPPIIPELTHFGDTTNFDAYAENDWLDTAPASAEDMENFLDF
ncbi:hypothetical protein SNE40_000930 [Patella caerulea]|uniref:Uncharacterized protein n=1 Tax=Patella caerulea TaxID=87958 RepID=A0AAN8KHK4_PATCE